MKKYVKFIPLTKGQFVMVDAEDFNELSKYRWHISGRYARRAKVISGKQTLFYMHRQLMGFPEGMQIDHISGESLDNRKRNLRICTSYQNSISQRLHKNNTSGFKGVTFCKMTGRWIAKIQADNRKISWLGRFPDKRTAALAYNEAAKRLHGEFAVLNDLGMEAR